MYYTLKDHAFIVEVSNYNFALFNCVHNYLTRLGRYLTIYVPTDKNTSGLKHLKQAGLPVE